MAFDTPTTSRVVNGATYTRQHFTAGPRLACACGRWTDWVDDKNRPCCESCQLDHAATVIDDLAAQLRRRRDEIGVLHRQKDSWQRAADESGAILNRLSAALSVKTWDELAGVVAEREKKLAEARKLLEKSLNVQALATMTLDLTTARMAAQERRNNQLKAELRRRTGLLRAALEALNGMIGFDQAMFGSPIGMAMVERQPAVAQAQQVVGQLHAELDRRPEETLADFLKAQPPSWKDFGNDWSRPNAFGGKR